MDLFTFSKIEKDRYKIVNGDGKSNYHTHTYYCDGENSPDEMVEKAISLGFNAIGFSGHQYSPQDAHYSMTLESVEDYKREVLTARDKFRDKIQVYLGVERDYCCDITEGFQYVIGSCHHIEKDGSWLCVDESEETMVDRVNDFFNGDYMAYVKCYYDLERHVLEKTKGQIVGHFDLIAKFNKGDKYFSEDSREYKDMAIEACDYIISSYKENKMFKDLPVDFPEPLRDLIETTEKPIFEINTGATINGRRDLPYPMPFIVEHLANEGVPLLMSSDCHDKRYLDFGFNALCNRYVYSVNSP